jgi:ribosomal protein S18 acetylase RimI-like enzyme
MLKELMQKQGSVLLKYTDEKGTIIGCVNLQQYTERLYLGMLCVSPVLQGKGTGKTLLYHAETYGRQLGCTHIYMSVISIRTELVGWYMRHGYYDTGERKPFPVDERMGTPITALEFIILEKTI